MLGCPQQHLEFPIWYLKKRGYVEIADNGQFGITVEGVDKLSRDELSLPLDRLLTASSVVMGTHTEERRSVHAMLESAVS
jgi:predicted ThiF/HesA family dinucleotide-utilizing enzyme